MTLSLGGIYHLLMELDSIDQTLSDEIVSVQVQLARTTEYVGSTIAPSSHWPVPNDWPGDSFSTIVRGLEQAKCKVESLHGSMREVAMASSRSRIRPLNILDLPDELLRKIFESFWNHWASEDEFFIPDYINWGRVEDTKNIRLTCRRFCNTSSHLLLRYVDVAMSPSSLTHLEEVACHPLLSKGIQAVRVHLDYFSATLATNIIHFTALAVEHLEHTLAVHRFVFEREGDEHLFGVSREALGPAIEKAELILEAWEDFSQIIARDSGGGQDILEGAIARSREVAGLVSAHEIYRQKYLAQESVLNAGTFTRAIVTAMSRMPTAKRFFVGDIFQGFKNGQFDYVKPFVDAVEDPEGLAASWTVRPQEWDGARANQLDDQPKEILLQLLMAVFNDGIPINYLCVELSPATDLSIPATREQLQQLTVGTERLRVFELRVSTIETGPTAGHGPEQIASFGSLISSCMGGKALRRLDVNLSFALGESGPQPPGISMGFLLVSRQCPDLKTVRLSHYPLHLSELKTFLEGLHGPLELALSHVLLLSGTWAEALDLIRDKANWKSSVKRQRGAECDDMSEEEILAIFGGDSYGKNGLATWYIRGYRAENPLRIRESTAAS